MKPSSVEMLDSAVEAAALALFESAGLPLEKSAAIGRADDNIGASIGFTSPKLRGALVLISTRELVARSLPVELEGGTSEEQISDWMGELANQLLGRLKNKLLALGVALEMSTPTVIWGLELASKETRSRLRRRFTFRHEDQPLSVFIDAVAAPDFEFTASDTAQGAGVLEGELQLF
ncbi:MAG TPA: chemotaxis protein CheX [Polyangiaceae bacterium]